MKNDINLVETTFNNAFTEEEVKKYLEVFEKNDANIDFYYPKACRRIRRLKRPFNFSIGGRGSGKTMGNLVSEAIEERRCFLYLRRTQAELDTILNDKTGKANPFKSINSMTGLDFCMLKINKQLAGIYVKEKSCCIGYAAALSTFANMRSVELPEVESLVYDEFIPEKHKKKIKGEADAFLNLYETISRNRELFGKEPLYVYLLSNANSLASPILFELNLMPYYEKMVSKHIGFMDLTDKGTILELYENKDFKEKKSQSALYKLTSGTRFSEMALNNSFAYDDLRSIISRPLREYNPIASFDRFGVFKHKSNGMWYISKVFNKSVPHYDRDDVSIRQFNINYGRWLTAMILEDKVEYEDYECKYIILDILF